MKNVTRTNKPEQDMPGMGLVPGIYRYCDRWCMHCNAQSGCALYIDYSSREKEKKEVNKKGIRNLLYVADEDISVGIDLEKSEWLPERDEYTASCYRPYYPGLGSMASEYLEDVIDWTSEHLIPLQDCPIAIQCRNILCYYGSVIMSRIQMIFAATGQDEFAHQDRKGFAKVVHVSLDYSRKIWDLTDDLLDEGREEIPEMKRRVEIIREDLEKWIPGGRDFVRRGLDD